MFLGFGYHNGFYWFLFYLFASMNNRRAVKYICRKCKKRIPKGDLHYVVLDYETAGNFYCRKCYINRLSTYRNFERFLFSGKV